MTERELTISYREACMVYSFGYTLAVFMATTVFGIVLEWTTIMQNTVRVLFLGYVFVGCVIFVVALYRPVWFYELLEGPYREDEDADVEEGEQ